MEIIQSISELIKFRNKLTSNNKTIGFIPTMGALHEGHLSLVKAAKTQSDSSIVSIFVNPTQFGPGEDYEKYPRVLEADLEKLERTGVSCVFTPKASDMYPSISNEFTVHINGLDKILCGASRPGHFNGVLLILSKLFHIIRPHKAFFGKKDFQQYTIVRQFVNELFFELEIVGCETIREADGLAMSSRNRYLSKEARKQATFLIVSLRKARQMALSGSTKTADIYTAILALAKQYPLITLDYFEIRAQNDLSSLEYVTAKDSPVALIAAYCDKTRLIDNLSLFP